MSVLSQLLDDNARFALSHRGTVNHLPMALIALSRVGASDARLKAYFDWWEENVALPREGPEPAVGRSNWREGLGQGAAFAPLADAFRAWVEAEGADAVAAEVAPAVIGSPGTLAFHAPIRLAYGLEAGHAGEIGAGLASWVAARRDFGLEPALAGRPRAASVRVGLDAVADAVGGGAPMGGSITGAMAKIAADPAFRGSLTRAPTEGAAILPLLATAALRLYWQMPNFTVLHLVTATHAARMIVGRWPAVAEGGFADALWTQWLAAYATVGAPRLEDRAPDGAAADWPAIFAAAVASDDDHVIKLTHSCHAEAAAYGDDEAYRAVSTRVVELG